MSVGTARESKTRRITKVEVSRFVLQSAGLTVSLMLLGWLLFWFLRGGPTSQGFLVVTHALKDAGQAAAGLPVMPFQAEDAAMLSNGADENVNQVGNLVERLTEKIRRHPGNTVLLYLSAPAACRGDRVFFLGAKEPYAQNEQKVTLEAVLDGILQEAKTRKVFLILDCVARPNDRDLGVFNNGFTAGVERILNANPKYTEKMVILCPSGPGQRSWTHDGKAHTAFAYFLAEGLSGKAASWGKSPDGLTVTVQGLYQYVRQHTAKWVKDNRGDAVQTPILLPKDTAEDFPLPGVKVDFDPDADAETDGDAVVAEREAQLAKPPLANTLKLHESAWASYAALRETRPYLKDPVRWKHYEARLLHAEQLMINKDNWEQAENILVLLGKEPLEKGGAVNANLPPLLALASAHAEDKAKKLQEIAEALVYLTGDESLREKFGRPATPRPLPPVATPKAPATAPAPNPQPQPQPQPQPGKTPTTPAASDANANAPGLAIQETGQLREPALLGALRQEAGKANGVAKYEYVQQQLVAHAGLFIDEMKDPMFFRGRRGPLLVRGVETRAVTEDALQWPESANWSRIWLTGGDKSRREAQDLLFSTDPKSLEDCEKAFQDARKAADDAYNSAFAVSEAWRLIRQLQAELPYYGAWKCYDGGIGDIEPLLKNVDALAEEFFKPLSGQAMVDTSQREELQARILSLETLTRRVTRDYTDLADKFRRQCEDTARLGGRADRLLMAPMIPAETRKALLLKALNRPAKSKVKLAPGSAIQSYAPDDQVIQEALGLGRLEMTLAKLSGAPAKGLRVLEERLQDARKNEKSPEAFAALSAAVMDLREAAVAQIADEPSVMKAETLVLRDRIARGLVVAQMAAVQFGDLHSHALRYDQERELIVWQALRLLDDYAPQSAQEVLVHFERMPRDGEIRAGAGAADETGATAKLKERIESVTRAKLRIRTRFDGNANGEFSGANANALPVQVILEGDDAIPPGHAVIWVKEKNRNPENGLAAQEPFAQLLQTDNQPLGVNLTSIPPVAPNNVLKVLIDRLDRRKGQAAFVPTLFYRGRIVANATDPILVRGDDVESGIEITLKEDLVELAKSVQISHNDMAHYGYKDQFMNYPPKEQFLNHPTQGYLYPDQTLFYEFSLRNKQKDLVKWKITYGLQIEGQPLTEITKTVDANKTLTGIKGKVRADSLPEKKPVGLVINVYDAQTNKLLENRKFELRLLPVKQYVSIKFAGFDRNLDMKANRKENRPPNTEWFHIQVLHDVADPVYAPVSVTASYNGNPQVFRGIAPNGARRIAPRGGGINRGGGWHFYFTKQDNAQSHEWSVDILDSGEQFRGKVDAPPPNPNSPNNPNPNANPNAFGAPKP